MPSANVRRTDPFTLLSRAAALLERHRGGECFFVLKQIDPRRLPSSAAAEWWDLLARVQQESGDFRKALLSYRRAAALFTRAGDARGVAETNLRLGDISRQLERFAGAIVFYGIAERRAPSSSDDVHLDALVGRGMALRGLGKYPMALAVFKRALSAYRRRRDREGEAYVLWAIGTTERFAGLLRDARVHLLSSVRLYRRLGEPRALAYALCGLGGTLRMLDRPAESGRLYREAYSIFRRIGDQFGLAYSSCGQGNALRMQGRFAPAVTFMNSAIERYRRLELHGPLGFVLWSRAQLRILTGSLAAARRDLDAAERSFRRAKDPRGLTYIALGRGELERGGKGSGERFYRLASRSAAKLGLRLEHLHARFRLGTARQNAYRTAGLRIPAYLAFRTLP